MIPYQKEKIENAICFFAEEHRKRTRGSLYQTFLYKYLAFLDFDSLERYGRPVLGLTYKAMEHGPVPIEIYDRRKHFKTDLFEFREEAENRHYVVCKDKPNLDFFSPNEIKLMKRLVEIFANKFISSRLISDASHQDILAWRKTWSREKNGIIDYSLTFNNLFRKSDDKLSHAEECYLIDKAVEN
jgi:hypothetical protein